MTARLTSTANPRFRGALALREAGARREQGRTLVDGLREIERALDAGVRPVEVFVDPDGLGPQAVGLVERARGWGAEVVEVSERLLARLAYGDRVVGVVMVMEASVTTLADLALPAEPLLLVVEGVEKPGNLGAIVRTADGSGVAAVIVADPHTEPFHPNAIRASLGTIFSLPVAVASSGDVLAWLRERNIRIVAARVDGTTAPWAADLTGPVAIALGSEARGLSDAWSELADVAVRIPMLGVADSLNVSATAAILCYEALRQRSPGSG